MKNSSPKTRTGWRKLLQWQGLAGLSLLLALAFWGLYAWTRPAPPPPPPPAPTTETGGRMETLSLTEIQEGDKRWVLEATKADFLKEKMEVLITGVRVEFFGPGEHIRVKADQGIFQTKTRVLTLKGNVEMRRGDMLVQTAKAIYQPNDRVLLAPEEVVLTQPTLRVTGKGLRVELAEKKLVLAQHRLTEVKTQGWEQKH
jgi:LPS export ABC transporter protein LptC